MRRRHRRVAIDDGPHEGSGEIRPPEISCEKEQLERLWCDTEVDSNACMMIDLSIGGGMKEREREREVGCRIKSGLLCRSHSLK